jgi:predicted RNA-binding Zn ribbon-like protein
MVSIREAAPQQQAPGSLERVRELLNSWLIPNDTREPTDRFDDHAPELAPAEREAVRRLRDDLRAVVEREPDSDERLNAWMRELDFRVEVHGGELTFEHREGPAGELLAIVVEAIAGRRWDRLKACPDCHWVFYDHTRNASKRWCLMSAGGPDGRSCGTIAKVRRYRQNHAGRSR